jgi:hypothetical protein
MQHSLSIISNFKCFEKKSCIDQWVQKYIEHQKFTQLPHQITHGPPLNTYIQGANCKYFCVICISKNYYFCPTFLHIFLLYSYFS